ncbi:helix-turn-helix transcriptional regulator [Alkalibacterium pelagium]|uniref:Putative transcriptional regulator n=1 Tax=Alkalibacterium pelagium TaxID=426702 RepID=A0A1H7IGJ0_9LACT|nr:transcriptional regulator [Alkalibacterium pelagium]GEN50075.1 hypothetical protein APE02nite_07400 [Alkalibacterium pelagium]SEK61434.1 putative transcriptional regulator [Alkalibacterium pelagium]
MANKIAGYRKMLGYNQLMMAKYLDISLTSYFNKEHGKTPFTDKEKIKIKELLTTVDKNITIDKIFF